VDVIAGKDLERYWEQQAALAAFHELFNERGTVDERAIAIVGAAFLDSTLEHILINFMADDEKETKRLISLDGPMGTFSNRVSATYCLGLICKTVRDDLRTVGKIRNKFAHRLEASFEAEPIQEWCLGLKWHRLTMMMEPPMGATARDVFKVGVNQLICYLGGIVSAARAERRAICGDDTGRATLLR
jgi:hypothetical protein